MTAHDPALVERLAKALSERWRTVRFSEFIAPALTDAVLDLLAVEGRLCEPMGGPTVEIVEYLNAQARKRGLPEDPAVRMARLEAEVDRLRAALAEVLEVLRTSRGAGDAARVAREALAEEGSAPNVTSEPPHRSDNAGPLIDPDCRDGKHSSCVGDPCECECHG